MAQSTPRKKSTPRSRGPARKLRKGDLDVRALYELAVQSPDVEIDFVTSQFKRLTGRPLLRVREDFCASAASACEFVRRSPRHSAVALDLHQPVLDYGMKHNVAKLPADAQARIRLLNRNVLSPGKEGQGVDAVLAMNFSYWVFHTREVMLSYFRSVHASLAPRGVLFMDSHGGWEATKIMQERRRVYTRGSWFTYVWDQAHFDPFTNRIRCHIHFEFPSGKGRDKSVRRAFTYEWRSWSIAELRELLDEAGFKRSRVYWEGDDGKGGGNGIFSDRYKSEQSASFICYIAAEK